MQVATYFGLFCLTCFGGSTIISQSKICKPVRDFFQYKPNRIARIISSLLSCHLCIGFWIGFYLGCIGLGPWEYMSLDDTLPTKVLDGFAGSAASWILYLLLKERMFGS